MSAVGDARKRTSGHEDRAALIESIYNHLWSLGDMDELSKIALATGLSVDEIQDLGGLA